MFVNKHLVDFTGIPRIKNAKFSWYYIYMDTSIEGNFQICGPFVCIRFVYKFVCISVPLNLVLRVTELKHC